MEAPFEAVNDPTYREYVMNCKTKFVFKNVREDIGKGIISQYRRKLVFLIPDDSDQRTRFLRAWMPETVSEYHEIAADIGAPIHGPARLSVHMGHDEFCEKPYLFVMSKGVEDILVKFPEGTTVRVKSLPANLDGEADFAAESTDGNYDVVE